MAYHYREPGFTRIEVGKFYSRWTNYHYHYKGKLKRYNPATGICVITYESGGTYYLSATELSHWHRVGESAPL